MKKISFVKKILFSIVMFAFFITTVKAFSNNLKEVKVVETNMDISNISINDSKNINDIIFSKKDDYVVLEFTISNNDEDKYSIENIVDNNTNNNILITYDYSKEKIDKKSDYSFKARLEYKNQLENVKKIDINDLKITIKLTRDDGKEKEIIVNPVTKDSVLYYLILLILSLIGLILIMVKKKKILGIPLLILVSIILLPIGIFAFQKYEYDVFIKHIEIKGVMLPYNVNFKVLDEEPITKIVEYGEEITELPIVNEPGYEFIKWQDQDGNKVDEHTIVTGELNVDAKLKLIPYTITFDLNGGHYEEGKENLNIYYVNSDDIVLNNPIKKGYNFAGWTGSNGDVLQTKVTIHKGTTENLTYTANYIASDDTEYKVIHRKQKLTLDGYEEADIDTLRGVTNTVVRPETNNYTGFISPIEQDLTITPDGNATITYDYDRKYYNYEVDDNTISSISEGSYPYETEITITPKDIPGYTFEKWSDNNQDNPRTIILDKDIVNLRPIYTPNTNTPYTVIHKFQNNDHATYTEEIENKTGTTDTEVTPGIIIRDGFIEPELQTGVIKGDGSLVITYVYDRKKIAILDTGSTVNKKIKALSGVEFKYTSPVNQKAPNIKSIVRSSSEPDLSVMTIDNIISSPDATAYIYSWFDNETIYYYSEEDIIYMNEDSSYLFSNLIALETINLNNFNTNNVTNMSGMFRHCRGLSVLDLSEFNTSNATDMSEMFYNCSSLTSLDLNNFNTNNVTNMANMFTSCSSLTSLDLNNFNTSNVTNMRSMFASCSSLTTLDLTHFNTSNVTDMQYMFTGCNKLVSLNTSSFNTNNVTTMRGMFSGCKKLTSLNISNFNTSNVTDMFEMFYNCSSLTTLDLTHFNTSNVTDMNGMFKFCSSLTTLDLSNFNTNNVTTMGTMFYGCSALTTLNLSSFNTSNVTDMNGMFISCSSLTTLDLSNFNTSNVIDMHEMFHDCRGLTTLNLSSFNTSNVKKMSYMFTSCSSLTTLDLSNFNTSNVTTMRSMFSGCNKLVSLNTSSFNTSNVTDMYDMFGGCSSFSTLNLNNFNTSNVTDMGHMFHNCSGLTTLDLSNFNTSNVTSMYGMFQGCKSMLELNLSSFNTNNVTSMYGMFQGCESIQELNLSSFNTSNVTDMTHMFYGCSSLITLNLNNFITSNVTDMNGMFANCSGLTTLDLSGFNTSNVKSMTTMFSSCSGLTSLNLSSFDTSNVTDMFNMFASCSSLTTLDLSNFNTGNVTNMGQMFYNCLNLTTIYTTNDFDVSNVANSYLMFRNNTNLTGGSGTTYDSSYADKTYAHIDGGVDNPGYFTYKESPLGASISVFKNMFNGGNKIILIISGIIAIVLGLILVLFKHKNKKKS